MSQNVSQTELKDYLVEKLAKLEREVEDTKKAIKLIDEAKWDILTKRLFAEPIIQPLNIDNSEENIQRSSEAKIIKTVVDAVEDNSDLAVATVKKIDAIVNPISITISPIFVYKDTMTVDYFHNNLKNIRNHLNLKISEVLSVVKINKGYLYLLEQKPEIRATRLKVKALADFYKIVLIDINQKFNGTDNYVGSKSTNIVGTIKTKKLLSGKIKREFIRAENESITSTTNGKKINRTYNKRESKPGSVEDA